MSTVALQSVSNPLPSLKLLDDALGNLLGSGIKKREQRGRELLGRTSSRLVSIQSRPSFASLRFFAYRGPAGGVRRLVPLKK